MFLVFDLITGLPYRTVPSWSQEIVLALLRYLLFIALLIPLKLLILKCVRYRLTFSLLFSSFLSHRGVSNSYCRNESGDDNFLPWTSHRTRWNEGDRKAREKDILPFLLLLPFPEDLAPRCALFVRAPSSFRVLSISLFIHLPPFLAFFSFYFSFVSSERADYNCKCYHKPGLTRRREVKWIGTLGLSPAWNPQGVRMMSVGPRWVLWMAPEE